MAVTPLPRMTTKYWTVLEQQPAYLTAIGTLAVEIVNIEVLLSELLAAILKIAIDTADAIYFAPQSTGPRLSMIDAAIKTSLVGSPHLKEATACVEKVRHYANKRNDIIHHAWGLHDDSGRISSRRLPFTDRNPARSIPVTDIQEQIYNVRLVAERVLNLIDQLNEGVELPPSRNRQPIPRAGAIPQSSTLLGIDPPGPSLPLISSPE
jgi:hypothetical protein